MRAINLKTTHLTAPVGIDAGPLFLSWQCADGVRQTAYEIQLTANGEMVWHSGKTEGAAMHADVPAVGGSRVSGCWRVRLWDENDVPGAWSEARFETGLAQCDWVAQERLNRLRALSSDSLSFTLISAIYYSLPTPYGWSYILITG